MRYNNSSCMWNIKELGYEKKVSIVVGDGGNGISNLFASPVMK